jgi:hypothetical protein
MVKFAKLIQHLPNAIRHKSFSSCLYGKQQEYVSEIDRWCQFHQHYLSSFYACTSQKWKKDSQVVSLFCALGICAHKSCLQYIDEISFNLSQFNKHFTSSFLY